MPRASRLLLAALALFVTLAVTGPTGALADNCGSSAGDTQYVDPLACGGTSGSAGSHSTHTVRPSQGATTSPAVAPSRTGGSLVANTASSTTTGTGTTTPSTTGAPVATTAAASTTSAGTTAGSRGGAGDLPYTGLDVRTVLLVGVGLLLVGVLLRRFAVRGARG